MLHLLQHPLADHAVTQLRDHGTQPATFRTLARQLGLMLALEATRGLPTRDHTVNTPLEPFTGKVLTEPLVVVPILRAGIGMVQPYLDLFPDVSVGYIGLERDHQTAIARNYYCKLPPLAGRRVLCIDPMLATGGSAVMALELLRQHGADDLALVVIVAAPEGVAAVHAAHPDLPIFAAALDRGLDANKYILPGLGDFGDRLFGT
jgi:uracil phosphoribosyltransferase